MLELTLTWLKLSVTYLDVCDQEQDSVLLWCC